eukprot:1557608-Pleurochrysis_carterae.AAC.1
MLLPRLVKTCPSLSAASASSVASGSAVSLACRAKLQQAARACPRAWVVKTCAGVRERGAAKQALERE